MKNILKMTGKKAIAPLFIILFIILVLIIIYCLLFIPIPAFTKVRMIVNYFLIIIFWIIIQVGLIFAYYKIGIFVAKGITNLKTKILNWTMNFKKYIILVLQILILRKTLTIH
jgi:hypothetical protein